MNMHNQPMNNNILPCSDIQINVYRCLVCFKLTFLYLETTDQIKKEVIHPSLEHLTCTRIILSSK